MAPKWGKKSQKEIEGKKSERNGRKPEGSPSQKKKRFLECCINLKDSKKPPHAVESELASHKKECMISEAELLCWIVRLWRNYNKGSEFAFMMASTFHNRYFRRVTVDMAMRCQVSRINAWFITHDIITDKASWAYKLISGRGGMGDIWARYRPLACLVTGMLAACMRLQEVPCQSKAPY